MRIHHLRMEAFGPFAGEVSVDLDALSDAGLFLLTGATGAGKTSVLDAICFALYGAVPGDRQAAKQLRSDQAAVRSLMDEALVEARARDLLRSDDLASTQIAGRALVYGLARMVIDGHFAQWAVDGRAVGQTMQDALSLFVSLMRDEQLGSGSPDS